MTTHQQHPCEPSPEQLFLYHLAENTTCNPDPQSFCCWWRVCGAAHFATLDEWRDSPYGDRADGRDEKNHGSDDMKCAKDFANMTGHIGASVGLKAIKQKIWADFSKKNPDQPTFPTYTLKFNITPDTASDLIRFSKLYVGAEECEAAFAEKTGEEEDEEMEKEAAEHEMEQLRVIERDHSRLFNYTPNRFDDAIALKEEFRTICVKRMKAIEACVSHTRKRKYGTMACNEILDEFKFILEEGTEEEFEMFKKYIFDRPRTKHFREVKVKDHDDDDKVEDDDPDVSSIFGT